MDFNSRLRYFTASNTDQTVAAALAAHRAFVGRLDELLAYEQSGGLSEVEALRLEVGRLRQMLGVAA